MVAKFPIRFAAGALYDVAGLVFHVVIPLEPDGVVGGGNDLQPGRAVGGVARSRVTVVFWPVTGMRLGSFAGLIKLAARQLIPLGGELLEFVEDILVALIVWVGDAPAGERVLVEVVPDEGM